MYPLMRKTNHRQADSTYYAQSVVDHDLGSSPRYFRNSHVLDDEAMMFDVSPHPAWRTGFQFLVLYVIDRPFSPLFLVRTFALNQDNINPLRCSAFNIRSPHFVSTNAKSFQFVAFPFKTFLLTIGPAGQEPCQIMPGDE